MNLELKNIGIIKEANIKLNGLTVIAGENDTGKSTVGKYIYSFISKNEDLLKALPKTLGNQNSLLSNIDRQIALFIDTPNSLDVFSFVKNATLLFHQKRLNIHLPDFRVDLILRLSQDTFESFRNDNLYKNIEKLIGGRVFYDKNKDDIFYEKYSLKNRIFKMKDTSNGIKMFGYLQMLILNQTLTDEAMLILDEPEVHLHPKWQLEYAKIIVELVKNGVKVLVNSHSPYMIEALETYASKEKINSNFYLAEQKNNTSTIYDVSDNLEPIYSKLAESIEKLEKESLEEFKW